MKKSVCIGVVVIIIGIGVLLTIHAFKKQSDNITHVNQDNHASKHIGILEVHQDPAKSEENVEEHVPEPNSNKVSDEAKIESMLENIFTEKLKDLKGSPADYSVFFENNNTNRDAKYFIDKLTFIKALYEREVIDKESMSIKLTFENITITDSTASVKLYEYFAFMYANGNGMPSSMGNNYDITLSKVDNEWKIVKMSSDDEFDDQYYETGFNLDELLDEID